MTTYLQHSARLGTGPAPCAGALTFAMPRRTLPQKLAPAKCKANEKIQEARMKEQESTLKEALAENKAAFARYEAAQERFRSDIRADIAERDQKAVERDKEINDRITTATFRIIGAIGVGLAVLAFYLRYGS